jgi:hypothetical protein
VPPEDRFCQLRELAAAPPRRRGPKPARPVFEEGRRWPVPPAPPPTIWRLSISYWRIGRVDAPSPSPAPSPSKRERAKADAATLRRLAEEPLRPVKPQKALDIGLFEVRLPEAPHIIVPDE